MRRQCRIVRPQAEESGYIKKREGEERLGGVTCPPTESAERREEKRRGNSMRWGRVDPRGEEGL